MRHIIGNDILTDGKRQYISYGNSDLYFVSIIMIKWTIIVLSLYEYTVEVADSYVFLIINYYIIS